MVKEISFCGMDCLACPAYMASQQGDKKALERIAFETEDGQHYSWCDICPVRKCSMDKKIKNCAYCIHYPCDELDEPFERLPNAKKTLDEIRKNL